MAKDLTHVIFGEVDLVYKLPSQSHQDLTRLKAWLMMWKIKVFNHKQTQKKQSSKDQT